MPGLKILYAEDEPDIRSIALMAFEGFSDFEVVSCADGREVLDAVAEFSPDLFLFDLAMPKIDGIEALRELRKDARYAATPVIFMTASAHEKKLQHFMAMGAIGIIVKPFDPLALCDRINDLWHAHLTPP